MSQCGWFHLHERTHFDQLLPIITHGTFTSPTDCMDTFGSPLKFGGRGYLLLMQVPSGWVQPPSTTESLARFQIRRYKKLSHRSNGFKDHQKRVIKNVAAEAVSFLPGHDVCSKGSFCSLSWHRSRKHKNSWQIFANFAFCCYGRWKSLEWSFQTGLRRAVLSLN